MFQLFVVLTYTQSRPYHQIDYNKLCNDISNDPTTVNIFKDTGIDSITQCTIDLISSHLQYHVPLKLIQIKKKNF